LSWHPFRVRGIFGGTFGSGGVAPLDHRLQAGIPSGWDGADLCAYPAARKILNPGQPNQAYDIIARHLYRREAVTGWHVTA